MDERSTYKSEKKKFKLSNLTQEREKQKLNNPKSTKQSKNYYNNA